MKDAFIGNLCICLGMLLLKFSDPLANLQHHIDTLLGIRFYSRAYRKASVIFGGYVLIFAGIFILLSIVL
jgi:hypothetical protein